MSEITPKIAPLDDAELDAVAAAGFSINLVGVFAAVQTNASLQASGNLLTIHSGNQEVYQSNNASIG